MVPPPVSPVTAPSGAAEVRAHGQTPRGRRCSQPLPGSEPHVQLGRPWRGVDAPWAPGRGSGACPAPPSSTLAGPSVQPREPLVGPALPGSVLIPAGVWVAATLDPSVPGSSCPCGMGYNCFRLPMLPPVSPPRHMCRDKTNSPGAPHCLAWPCVRLSVTWARPPTPHGFPLRGWPGPCLVPVHSRQQCTPRC